MAALRLLFKKMKWRMVSELGRTSPPSTDSGHLVWEGSVKTETACCRVVWELKE